MTIKCYIKRDPRTRFWSVMSDSGKNGLRHEGSYRTYQDARYRLQTLRRMDETLADLVRALDAGQYNAPPVQVPMAMGFDAVPQPITITTTPANPTQYTFRTALTYNHTYTITWGDTPVTDE
jgi:hypothetical protein